MTGKGQGGSNVATGDGPVVKGSKRFPFRIENDGDRADRIKLVGIESSRSLAGIDLTVNGLHLNDATGELGPAGCAGSGCDRLDGEIVVTVESGAGKGKYAVVLTLRANGTSDPAQSDSVTLRFVVQ